MFLSKLRVEGFRNLNSIEISPGPAFNIFYGLNGSGKTSLLEAIYYLSYGRSFRTSNLANLIGHAADAFHVFTFLVKNGVETPLGSSRHRSGERRFRLNEKDVLRLSLLAQEIPSLLLTTNSYSLFTEGPKQRRLYLDWGLFHVKQEFFSVWQYFQRGLKQRNAALKARASRKEVELWDAEIIPLANQIDEMRAEYLAQLIPVLRELCEAMLPEFHFEFRYDRGWENEKNLLQLFSESFYVDFARGYTRFGPQRADFQALVEGRPVEEVLSQGQLKLCAYAFYLAQGRHVQASANKRPLYLVDDLPSELDPGKRQLITKTLNELGAQVFISGITLSDLEDSLCLPGALTFHVKQGQVVPHSPL